MCNVNNRESIFQSGVSLTTKGYPWNSKIRLILILGNSTIISFVGVFDRAGQRKKLV